MQGKTILAVDDERHILQVVSLKLRNAGFHVITATDGEEAFELSANAAIDLVVTDFHMPGMSGMELSAKLRAQEGREHLPIILLTAHGLALEPETLKAAGISRCVSKPFSPREVLGIVTELLREAQARPLQGCVES